MTHDEHLLQITSEECAEIAQECAQLSIRLSKALRFGLTEAQSGQEQTNAERIMVEFEDLCAVIELCQARKLLRSTQSGNILIKKAKVAKYMGYAKEQGTIT